MSSAPELIGSALDDLFGPYRPGNQWYDESMGREGGLREHWISLAGALQRLGRHEISHRGESGRRIIREHGTSYNIYGDPRGSDRPWELDVVPLLISAAEWRGLKIGIAQRARLLNRILEDLYGPQELLRTGALPPALVFANSAFLRPCHGLSVAKNIYLHLYAADLARSPSGQWWVLADRTQAPSGSGYALENRIVVSRVLPNEYKQAQVHRLAPFFATQRENLRNLAPRGIENPHIVLLTPGPHNETYFEHVYLAHYLGFTLVEGADLTVRDSTLYLKTLEGLQKVDVLLRRVDDTFCDPLELRGDSFLGVAGLVQAVRSGNVTVANALGSTLVESPAFLAFLPGLCKLLLGEELLIPSVATWWCGQGKEQKHVLEHLDEMVVKPAFGAVSQLPFYGRQLKGTAREQLVAQIKQQPFAFVGQEPVAFSTAPAWISDALEPRGVAVRFYATATEEDYTVMPGGLTRISGRASDPVLSMQSGGGSKDTWILADGPVPPITLLTPLGQPTSAVRSATEVPSRVADNLFWLGRYSERLECTLRLLRCVFSRISDESSPEAASEMAALIEIFSLTERIPKEFSGRIPAQELEDEMVQLVYNTHRTGSARELALRLRQIASAVRDRLSADIWRILNKLQADAKTRAGRLRTSNALNVCNTLIIDLAAFNGMEMENMTRGRGWRFLELGRRIERAFNLAEILRATLQAESRSNAAKPLLEFADSTISFQRRYHSQASVPLVLDLLLTDRSNPRSLPFQLHALREHANDLPQSQSSDATDGVLQRVNAVSNLLNVFQLEATSRGDFEPVEQLLAMLIPEITAVSDCITEQYFCHTLSQRVEDHS